MTIAFDPLALLQEAAPSGAKPADTAHSEEGDAFAALLEIFRGLLGEVAEDSQEGVPTNAPIEVFGDAGGELALGIHLKTTPDPLLDRTHFTLRAALATLAPETDAPLPSAPVPNAPAADAAPPRPVAQPVPTPEPMNPLAAPTPPTSAEGMPMEDLPPASTSAMPGTDTALPGTATPTPVASPPVASRVPTVAAELRTQPPSDTNAPTRAEGAVEDAAQAVVSSNATESDDGQPQGFGSRGNEGEAAPRAPLPATMPLEPNAESFSIGRTAAPTAPDGPAVTGALRTPTAELPARITWLAQQGGGTARLALHPADLGEVEVAVRVRGNSVEIQFVADDPAAQLAVSNARDNLMEALGARELRMESFQVRGSDDAASSRDFAGSPERDAGEARQEASGRDPGSEREPMHTQSSQAATVTPGEAIASLVAPSDPTTDTGIDVRV